MDHGSWMQAATRLWQIVSRLGRAKWKFRSRRSFMSRDPPYWGQTLLDRHTSSVQPPIPSALTTTVMFIPWDPPLYLCPETRISVYSQPMSSLTDPRMSHFQSSRKSPILSRTGSWIGHATKTLIKNNQKAHLADPLVAIGPHLSISGSANLFPNA